METKCEMNERIEEWINSFLKVRNKTEQICKPLIAEDYSIQPIDFVSPPKWHLAHTTWFFEQFVLCNYDNGYEVFDDDFFYLFNSYYNHAGDRVIRANRGLMTRPSILKIREYRDYITQKVCDLLGQKQDSDMLDVLEIGMNHEQQHQELLAYDIKYILGHQPTFPSCLNPDFHVKQEDQDLDFVSIEEGIYSIGCRQEGFHFDNELGVHKVYLQPYSMATKLVTNGEYIEFIEAGGYQNFDFWHAEGWDWVRENTISRPMYWHNLRGKWFYYDYSGLREVDLSLPVQHVSYYEAFAYAEWKELRLPTEFEWEVASSQLKWGQLWEWTSSAYLPYPGYRKAPGAIGEYNGKFMVNQHVLRGASVATPKGHSRYTYRNFFHPQMRWMFSGIRLAK